MVLVDALRAKSLGCYGYEKNISPAIDNLANKGTLIENCFTCSNASDPALTSLMSGMLTRSHGIVHHSFDVNDDELKTFDTRKVRLLQEVLKEKGYNTFGLDFLARWHMRGYDYYSPLKIDRTKRKKLLNRLSRLFASVGLKLYFKKIHATKTMRLFFGGFDSYPKDNETVQKALELIAQKKDPYFLFVHLWGVHKPYICPQVENKLSIECYDGAIEIIDNYIKQIADAAGKETLIIILGDHGESLGEHGIKFDHHGLYDPSLQIPLIFSGSTIPAGKRIKGLTSITDVFGTILSLAGITYPEKTDSHDLSSYFTKMDSTIRDFIFAEENYYQDKVCLRTKQYKFIKTTGRNVCELCHVVHGDDVELFDLEKDPQELHNIASMQEEKVASFEDQIKRLATSGGSKPIHQATTLLRDELQTNHVFHQTDRSLIQ